MSARISEKIFSVIPLNFTSSRLVRGGRRPGNAKHLLAEHLAHIII